jgi:rare lipoprotein A
MKKIIFAFFTGFIFTVLCFSQARTGEINKGFFYQEGIASWYGSEFNGRPTASGEAFNDSELTAARAILPVGTMLKVTNQHNNKSVTVRINDRGPFVAARIIDISRAAAEQLDMLRTGTAPVKIESLHEVSLPSKQGKNEGLPVKSGEMVQIRPAPVEPYSNLAPDVSPVQNRDQASFVRMGSPESPGGEFSFHPAIPETITGKNYRVQVGAYKQREYAEEAHTKLKKAGFNPSYELYDDYYRVIITGIRQEELKIVAARLQVAGYKEALLREE